MKAGREHHVPLSKAAIQLLTSLVRVDSNDFVFPGAKVGVPMSDASVGAVIKRMKSDAAWADDEGASIVPHGFRSTFRMWAAEATHYPREVAEHALAHQLPDKVEAAYQRGTQFPKRVAMMNEWAGYLTGECAKPAQAHAAKVHQTEDLSLKVQLHEPA
jgi:integrase